MIDTMAATIGNGGSPRILRSGTGDIAAATPAGLRRIVVPVDGSPFAERALPVATWVARAFSTPMHLVEAVSRPAGTESAGHYLDELARRNAARSWDVAPGDDPAGAIIAATETDAPSIACMATRGRDRSATILGSVAASLLDRATEPVLLVGPDARPPCASDAPVVVAVDGANDADDAALVGVALGWATSLGTGVVIATVAEPVPGAFHGGRPVHRARGPADPEGYVAELAAELAGASCAVDTRVVFDPISVRDGLVRVVDRTAALLVIGSHRRTRPRRAMFGSQTTRVIHDISVPALVVPLDRGDRQPRAPATMARSRSSR
jgi:nucleotide-binding universal stress UspA family protein